MVDGPCVSCRYTGFLEVDWESVRHVDGHTYHFVAKHVQGGFAGNVDSGKRSNLAVTHDGGALRVTAADA